MIQPGPKFDADAFSRALAEWATATVSALQPSIQAVLDAMKLLYDATYTQYLSAGAPYGETHDGFMRWLEDLHKIRDLESQIDNIRIRHEWQTAGRELARKVKAKQSA